MNELPDFLKLSDADRDREAERQKRLRQDFFSRATQTGIELEAARAIILEDSLRESGLPDQLAENLAAQGRFTEAFQTAEDSDLKAFLKQCETAIYNRIECDCVPEIQVVEGKRIKLPKYRVIREAYSLLFGSYGYIVACTICDKWRFTTINPTYSGTPVSDLIRLKA